MDAQNLFQQAITRYAADEQSFKVANQERGVLSHSAVDSILQKAETEGENKVYLFKITTNQLDRANDRVNIDGLKIDHYLKNPIVLWNHSSYQYPIGKSLTLQRSGNAFYSRMIFQDVTEMARDINKLVDGGFLKATSIGFIPLAWEDAPAGPEEQLYPSYSGNLIREYTKSELLEYSICPIPMNPGATVENSLDSVLREAVQRGVLNTDSYLIKTHSPKITVTTEEKTMNAQERAIKALQELTGKNAEECEALLTEALVKQKAETAVTKAGRKISAKNLEKLKKSLELQGGAKSLLEELITLAENNGMMDDDEEEDDETDDKKDDKKSNHSGMNHDLSELLSAMKNEFRALGEIITLFHNNTPKNPEAGQTDNPPPNVESNSQPKTILLSEYLANNPIIN